MERKQLDHIFIELDIVENPKLSAWDADVQAFVRKHRLSICADTLKPGTLNEPQSVYVKGTSDSLWSFWDEFLLDEPTHGLGLRKDAAAS